MRAEPEQQGGAAWNAKTAADERASTLNFVLSRKLMQVEQVAPRLNLEDFR
jgi:hypothetical protein